MRKINLIAASIAATAIGTSAMAQSSYKPIDVSATGISTRLGVVLPIDSTLQDVGKTLVGLGIDVNLSFQLLKGGETYVSLDYITKGFQGDKGSVWPLAINQRFYTGERAEGRRTYAFVGVGIAFIDATSSGTAALLRGGVGVELGDNIFFESALNLSDRAGGARANSIGFFFGYRF